MIVEHMALDARAEGSPADFVVPEEGGSLIAQLVAIVERTDDHAAARAFVDWQLGRASQVRSAGQGTFPILPDVAPPEGSPAVAALVALAADAAMMLADDQANAEVVADLFGG